MSTEETELDGLMARLADGDRDAFDPLFRALHPRALRLARARLAPDVAVDAAQSALLKVFARASDFRRGAPVLPWFYAIAANEVRALVRRERAESARTGARAAGDALSPAAPDDPERLLVERELRVALERALEALDGDSAEAIHAVLERGDRPAIEAATFRKRVSRVYARLRLLLGGADE